MMTTENNDANPIRETPATPASGAWGKWAAIGAVAAMLIGGAGIAGAMSDEGGRFGMGWSERGEHMTGGGHFMKAGFGGHGIGRVMSGIDATDEQEDKLWAIFDGVHTELRPMMREFSDTREDLAKLLSAATIDTQAIETMRAERVAAVDEASKKVTTAMVEAANVLTPEQRAQLIEHFEKRGGRGRW